MFHMIASFPGSCVGRHEPRNEANHMIDFKKSHQHNYVLVCVCVCVCVCVWEGEVLIVLQATTFAEGGGVWSRSNHQVVTTET